MEETPRIEFHGFEELKEIQEQQHQENLENFNNAKTLLQLGIVTNGLIFGSIIAVLISRGLFRRV